MTHRQRSDAQSRPGGHLPGMSIRVAVVVGRATGLPAGRDPNAARSRLLAAGACLPVRRDRGSRLGARPAPTPTQPAVTPP
jgi:hypothetical protein